MRLIVQIDLDNAAFDGDAVREEVATILSRLAGGMLAYGVTAYEDRGLLDSNGIRVGSVRVTDQNIRVYAERG